MKASNPQVGASIQIIDKQNGSGGNEITPFILEYRSRGGEDGRIKSALGIGALLEDGIGDTIRGIIN